MIADDETDKTSSIKIFDIKENNYVKTLFEHPDYDVRGAILDIADRTYLGAFYYDDRYRVELENKKLQAHYDGLNKYFNHRANVRILAFSKDGSKSVVYVSSPEEPGTYYYYDLASTNIAPILHKRNHLRNTRFGFAEIKKIKMRDGSLITTYLTHPATGKTADAPLIILPYGGPHQPDYFDFEPVVQFLATRGYRVVQINFRGSSGFGNEFEEAGYRQWGGLMQDDVTDVARQLHDEGYASPDRTCVMGYSYGGYVALWGCKNAGSLSLRHQYFGCCRFESDDER